MHYLWAKQKGFTIVELLIVIVVIGILAAITIVAYSGIQQRAVAASLTSDLDNGAKLLKLDQVSNSAYPATLALANGGNNIPASAGTVYQYTVNNSNPQTFCLTATKGTTSYNIANAGTPSIGVCPFGWWTFNGNANDSSGNGNHGVVNGATLTSGVVGQAYSFDGVSNNTIGLNTSFGVLANYTISFWAKRNVENTMPISSGYAFYWYGDNSWKYTHGGVAGEYYYPKSVSIPIGAWGFYCVTYDGTNVRIYRNNALEGSQASSGSADFSSGFLVGARADGYMLNGSVEDIRLYRSALSTTDVQALYKAGAQ